MASLVAQTVKNLPATWETRVQSLGQEDPLEKEMAAHSSILAWRSLVGYSPWGHEESDSNEQVTHREQDRCCSKIFLSASSSGLLGNREFCIIEQNC